MLDEWNSEADFPVDVDIPDQCRPTILHLVEEMQKRGAVAAQGLKVLERQLALKQTTTHELIHAEHQQQAANQVTMGNVITSMRLISSLDWVLLFERINLAEAILRRDPAGVYSQMDFPSRDRYRHAVEEISKGSRLNDRQVAAEAPLAKPASHFS